MLASAVFFSHRKWLGKKQQHQSKAVAEISPIPVSVAFFLLGRVFSANANSRVDMMVSLHTNSCAFAQIPWTDCLLAKVCMQSIVVHYNPGIACSNATTIWSFAPFRIYKHSFYHHISALCHYVRSPVKT